MQQEHMHAQRLSAQMVVQRDYYIAYLLYARSCHVTVPGACSKGVRKPEQLVSK